MALISGIVATPKRVDEACKLFEYIPYKALTPTVHLKAANGDQEISLAADGSLTMKSLDRKSKRVILEVEWHAAAKTVVGRIHFYHGNEQANALEKHNSIMWDIAASMGWRKAVKYDILQRELLASDWTHNISTLNDCALNILAAKAASQPMQHQPTLHFQPPSSLSGFKHSDWNGSSSFRCVAATFNITAAYWITPVKPDQQFALCVGWEGLVYVDQAVIFGLASSVGVFGSIADMLVAIYDAKGMGPVVKWVDNFFAVHLPHHTWTEEEFMATTGDVGVPWSLIKVCRFASTQRYTGFDWDLEAKTVVLRVGLFLNSLLEYIRDHQEVTYPGVIAE
ncbi:hypothetical protein EV360DRAFT_83677 [Lentinula raphanica]|nr:hypothetical protein EV360DRAFT_83677 [Lentinula raphanica]